MSLNASAPLPTILDALARSGWAELDGRAAQGVRSVLRGLAALLPYRSATGLVTANQVADAAGLKSRQTRDNLQVLEEAGLIVWTRGGIVDGRPQPGVIKVNKKALLALVHRARHELPARLARRAAATAQRLRDTLHRRTLRNQGRAQAWRAGRRNQTAPDKARNPAHHAAFSATPSPFGEVTGRPPVAPALPLTDTGQTMPGTQLGKHRAVGSRAARLRDQIRQQRGQAPHPQPSGRAGVSR